MRNVVRSGEENESEIRTEHMCVRRVGKIKCVVTKTMKP